MKFGVSRGHMPARSAYHLAIRLVLCALLFAVAMPSVARSASTPDRAVSSPAMPQHVNAKQRLIVRLFTPDATRGERIDGVGSVQSRDTIRRVQDGFVQRHAGRIRTTARFQLAPFIGVETDAAGRQALAADPAVVSIHEDRAEPPTLAESVRLIGGSETGFGTARRTGVGQTIAILDTGVMKSHAFLKNKVLSEACYSTTSGNSIAVCASGSTEVGSGEPCSANIADCDHGTHVAGIAAGRPFPGAPFSGVARNAKLISIQVFSQFFGPACAGTGTCVLSYTSDQMRALERVYILKSSYDIAAVNISIGGGSYTSACDDDPRKVYVDILAAFGTATVISAGNSGYNGAVGAPGCISSAITVASTTKTDAMSSFSNNAPMVDLLAPGSDINSATITSTTGFAVHSGTSMAAPHVAGLMAILREQKPTMTVEEALTALRTTGKPITDVRNGIVGMRVRGSAAVNTLTTSSAPTLSAISPTSREMSFPDFTVVVTGTNFVPASVVRWRGLDRPTQFISPTLLKARISKADLATPGTYQIKVWTPAPGGGLSQAQLFTVLPPSPAPTPIVTGFKRPTLPAGTGPWRVFVRGKNFVPRSVIQWGDQPMPTQYVSKNELLMTLTTADILEPASVPVSVVTSAPGGGTSNALPLTIGPPPAPCEYDEPNNWFAGATVWAPFGMTRTYAFCSSHDFDIIKIEATAGMTYTINAFDLGPRTNVVIVLHDASMQSIQSANAGYIGESETLQFVAERTGTYFVNLYEWDNQVGPELTYRLRITESDGE